MTEECALEISFRHLVISISCVILASTCSCKPLELRQERPSILLVTLDTTRFDSIGPDAVNVATPAFNSIALRGQRFLRAYAVAPETLPSHSSMMTGLYPRDHGVRENIRYVVSPRLPLIAERLHLAGYRTAAFVSSFVLARLFGLARGFDVYDDLLPEGSNERSSEATTDAAVSELLRPRSKPCFVWVHYFDPHYPYQPAEPYRTQYRLNPYLGEIAAMDKQLGRLVDAFERNVNMPVVIIAADHGEGLGNHGELQHGNLLYDPTIHVPLLVMGPGIRPGTNSTPVSTRRIYHTILDVAGIEHALSLRPTTDTGDSILDGKELVLGEAMKPYLEFGWQPQVMAVANGFKTILSGRFETYALADDPQELNDLRIDAPPADVRTELANYPVPSPAPARTVSAIADDSLRRLASLGYVSKGSTPLVRKDAPRAADMTAITDRKAAISEVTARASELFEKGFYSDCISLYERVVVDDPRNMVSTLHLATAYSMVGNGAEAIQVFQRAEAMNPGSDEVRTSLASHYVRNREWDAAAGLLERVVKTSPNNTTAISALISVKLKQGERAMAVGDANGAIFDYERARRLRPTTFTHDLELGTAYFAARRFVSARVVIDRFLIANRDDAMGLLKRAQVSVLLNEPDRYRRITLARRKANAATREMIEREPLFR